MSAETNGTSGNARPREARLCVILDRDGVLNRRPVKARYVRNWSEWEWLPGAKEAVCLLKRSGRLVILATNQAGVGRGHMTLADLEDIHSRMQADLLARCGAGLDAIYCCPHAPDAGCDCRKPKPGMLLKAARDFGFDLSKAIFIGDDERDMQAGRAAGCRVLLAGEDRPLLEIVKSIIAGSV